MAADHYDHLSRLTVRIDLYHDQPGEDLAEDAASALARVLRDRHDCQVEGWSASVDPVALETESSAGPQ